MYRFVFAVDISRLVTTVFQMYNISVCETAGDFLLFGPIVRELGWSCWLLFFFLLLLFLYCVSVFLSLDGTDIWSFRFVRSSELLANFD